MARRCNARHPRSPEARAGRLGRYQAAQWGSSSLRAGRGCAPGPELEAPARPQPSCPRNRARAVAITRSLDDDYPITFRKPIHQAVDREILDQRAVAMNENQGLTPTTLDVVHMKVKNPGISERHDRGTAEVSVVSLREERTPCPRISTPIKIARRHGGRSCLRRSSSAAL